MFSPEHGLDTVSTTPSAGMELPPAMGWEGNFKRLRLAAPRSPGWEKPGQTPLFSAMGFFAFPNDFYCSALCKHEPSLGDEGGWVHGEPSWARLGEVVSGPAMPSKAGGTGVGTGMGTLWCPSAEMLLVPLIKAADLCTKFWSLIPWGLSLSSRCETFICF